MSAHKRLDGIDFWRGCVLCTIFIDHMPGNVYEHLTQRNFGFSDAAEAFVFLSGVSMALAYGRRFSALGQRLQTLAGLARRELKLYGVHIGLSIVALAIFFIGAEWADRPQLLAVHGRDLFVGNPGLGVLGLISLGHQLGYFNILPLYIILILFVPALLWLAAIDMRLMLGVSALVYVVFRFFNLNLPNWPVAGVWFFNPFAWQLLFAIGIALGLNLRNAVIPVSRPLGIVAALIVVTGVVVVTRGFGFAADNESWRAFREWLDVGKAQLGVVRIAHFLALAYLVYVSGITERLRRWPIYGPATLLGRHSLWVFALLSLFSAVWQVLVERIEPTVWFSTIFLVGSLAAIYLATRLVDGLDRAAAARAPQGAADPSRSAAQS